MGDVSASDTLPAEVRSHCAAIAGSARWVTIDVSARIQAGGTEGLDPELHFLSGDAEEVARYVLVLDSINFGSGWFDSLDLPLGASGTSVVTQRLTEHARARGGTWSPAELATIGAADVAAVVGQDPRHELMRLYAAALRQLGVWLAGTSSLARIAEAQESAARLARQLADGMPFFADAGFYKRAQITANDLVHAGVADFADVDELTIFADNLVPHVLRVDGVLSYAPELAAHVDSGRELPAGGALESEIRACAVHACEVIAQRFGVPPRRLDNWLWNRGERLAPGERRPHKTTTVFY